MESVRVGGDGECERVGGDGECERVRRRWRA